MRFNTLIPLLGSSLLASGAAALGYVAMTMTPAPTLVPPADTVDGQAVSTTVPNSNLSMPQSRPDVFYQAITQRPLFAPSRRPNEPVSVVAPATTTRPVQPQPAPIARQPENLRLTGVFGQDAAKSALIDDSNGHAIWVQVETQIDGWTVTDIGADWILLSDGDATFRLELFE